MSNIPKGYKLVPVEPTEEMYLAFCEARGRKGSTYRDGLRVAIAAAPNLTQPIYDEAKERALFETWALEQIGPYFNKHEDCLVRTDHGGYVYGQTVTSWLSWKACANSRSKAGEVGHE